MTEVKNKPSKDLLIYHIQSEGLNDNEISKIYNCSPQTIQRTREKYNLLDFRKWRLSLLPTHWYCKGLNKVLPIEYFTPRSDSNYVQYCRVFISQKYPKFKQICLDYLGQICNRCGEHRQAVLEFHHVDEKEQAISILIRNLLHSPTFEMNKIPNKLLIELDKCEILCSNCHKLLHYVENQKRINKEYETITYIT